MCVIFYLFLFYPPIQIFSNSFALEYYNNAAYMMNITIYSIYQSNALSAILNYRKLQYF